MTKNEKLQMCRGCGNDFYNDHNDIGVKECWSLKDAEPVTRYAIGYWTPMDTAKNLREVRVLDCYHERGSGRTVYMSAVPQHLRAEWNQLQTAARIRAACQPDAPARSVGAVVPVGERVTD